MATYYTKAQLDSIATTIGTRIKDRTTPAAIKLAYESNLDTNAFTDAEKTKLAGLEGSKFQGLYTAVANIPVVGQGPGNYAYVDDGTGSETQIAIWDDDDSTWILQANAGTETAASIKTKYESNADTNAFTDAEKTKLADLNAALNITDFVAALDAALA